MKNNFDINVLSGNLLPVMETFQTIQGEGYFKGSSAYFIRIGGCDVGCHWCDVPFVPRIQSGDHVPEYSDQRKGRRSNPLSIVLCTY